MEVHNVIFNGKYNAENIDKLATAYQSTTVVAWYKP